MRSYVVRQPLWQELAPYPGRLAGSLRDTLGVVIALVAAMTLRVPGVALALALLFLMQRERPSLTFRVGVQILAGAAFSCAATLFWVQLTDGSEAARFLGILVLIFAAAFCMESTTLPLFWTITAFYGFLDLAAWDAHRSASSIVAGSLYNVASLGIVVGSAVMVEFASAISHPAAQLEREMNRRLSNLAAFFRALAARPSAVQGRRLRVARLALLRQMQAGDVHLNELYDRLHDTADSAQVPLGIHYRVGLLTRAIEKSICLAFETQRHPDKEYRAVYRAFAQFCTSLRKAERPAHKYAIPDEAPALAREILVELRRYARVIQPPEEPAPARVALTPREKPWNPFLPGAFSSPDTAFYALKVTLAAAVCYTIYNAVSWPEILTCVVTVIFTGLTSTGAMKQKQFYRFSGAAIGGALGIAVVSLLLPNMDSITALVLVVAPVAFLAGWVTRSPNMGYVGVQIGFGFFLTALPGFAATTNITPARDRLIGVGLGILVMWFIFDQLWPARTSDVLAGSLRRIRAATAELAGGDAGSAERRHFQHLRKAVSQELMNVQQLEHAARFDVGRHHKRELARSRRLIRQIETAASEFYQRGAAST